MAHNVVNNGHTDPEGTGPLHAAGGMAIATAAQESSRPSVRFYANLVRGRATLLDAAQGQPDEQAMRDGLIRAITDLDGVCRDNHAWMDQAN
ncbi:hypothetical protein [Actinoplanes regularis]|uniref:hypothetical protein n=1 Tax=Actinoplanes regularis TaxID=52697 RepID=UPI002554AE84|nr:hypothetical protein [Actinoplanes regularis]